MFILLLDWMKYLESIFGYSWKDENRNGIWDPTEGN